MEWVKTSERLPEANVPVLVLFYNGDIRVGLIEWEYPSFEETYEAFRYWDDAYNEGADWQYNDITHWMPLPEPPNV